ncbi:hypothetical protein [Pseudalkalibacillus hwajinpoensis]|uniref:hypothetical protein n=1 Tax=Guptibacillus hwajinpoensis TaxID=208199 RepID=UPI001CFE79E4|nr:hypothetical protein [Pseudalkalibacillus hwajinpoensis]
MRKRWILSVAMATLLLAGCANQNQAAEIEASPESDYVKTFEELSLGRLFDFQFELKQADKRGVKLWVEHYQNGKKEDVPAVDLIYGEDPNNETAEGHLGFGIITPTNKEPLYFLYAPGVSLEPQNQSGVPMLESSMATWDYAFKDKKVDLSLNEEKVLAVYRSTTSDEMGQFDLNNPDDVEKMIQEDSEVLLLKILITEKKEE